MPPEKACGFLSSLNVDELCWALQVTPRAPHRYGCRPCPEGPGATALPPRWCELGAGMAGQLRHVCED